MAIKLNPPQNDLSDSDLMWEFTNFDVEDWVASLYQQKVPAFAVRNEGNVEGWNQNGSGTWDQRCLSS